MFKPTLPSGKRAPLLWEFNLLKITFCWPLEPEVHIAIKFIYNAARVALLSAFLFIVSAEFTFFFKIKTNINDSVDCLATSLIGVQLYLRWLNLWWNSGRLRSLIDKFYKNINKKHFKSANRTQYPMNMLAGGYCVSLLAFLIPPILRIISVGVSAPNKLFPYKMVFTYDAQTPLNYVLTLIISDWIGSCILILIGEDSLISLFLAHICEQFCCLHEELRSLFARSVSEVQQGKLSNFTDQTESELIYKNFKEYLRVIVNKHQALIDFVQECEALFSKTFLLIFIFTTFVLCVATFPLVNEGLTTGTIKFVLWAPSIMIELFLLSGMSQKLINVSEQMYWEYYSSNWEMIENNQNISKAILLCMFKSQRPLKFTAWKFFPVSLQSFTLALKTSMSYLMFLDAIKN